MAGLKISELPAASALTGPELFEVVQGGVSHKATLTNVAAALGIPSVIVDGKMEFISAGATHITLPHAYISGSLDVYRTGALLKTTQYTEALPDSLDLTFTPDVNDEFIIKFKYIAP